MLIYISPKEIIMKKCLFKGGSINYFYPTSHTIHTKQFEDSKINIENKIPLYDVENIPGTDYYAIFQKFGGNGSNISFEEVCKRFKKIYENILICDENIVEGSFDAGLNSDVIWDTKEDIVYIKGMRNTRLFAIELLIECFTRLGEKRTSDMILRHIIAANDCEIIRKTCLSQDWLIQESEEELVNISRKK